MNQRTSRGNAATVDVEEEFRGFMKFVKGAIWILSIGGPLVLILIGVILREKFNAIEENTKGIGAISTDVAAIKAELVGLSSSTTRIENSQTDLGKRLNNVEVAVGSLADVGDRLAKSEEAITGSAEKVTAMQLKVSEQFQLLKTEVAEMQKSAEAGSKTAQENLSAALATIKEHESKLSVLDTTVANKVTESLQELEKSGTHQTMQGRFALTPENLTQKENPLTFVIKNAVDFGLVPSESSLRVQNLDLITRSTDAPQDYLLKGSIDDQRNLTILVWHKSAKDLLGQPISVRVVFRID